MPNEYTSPCGSLSMHPPSWPSKQTFTMCRHLISRKSDVTNLCLEVVQLLLHCGVFLGHLLVLRLPLITVLLKGLDFAFEVASLDIGLTESGMVSLRGLVVGASLPPQWKKFHADVANLLVVSLSQILIGLLSFLLQELQSPLKSLILCTMVTALLS